MCMHKQETCVQPNTCAAHVSNEEQSGKDFSRLRCMHAILRNTRMQLAGNAIWAIIGYLKLVCVVNLSTLKNAGTGLVDREVSRIASEHHVRVPAAGGSGINLHIVQIVRLMKCGSVFLERYGWWTTNIDPIVFVDVVPHAYIGPGTEHVLHWTLCAVQNILIWHGFLAKAMALCISHCWVFMYTLHPRLACGWSGT